MHVLSDFIYVWFFVTPWTVPTRLLCAWDSPGKNNRVGCHALLQGIFLTQGWKLELGFPAFQVDSLPTEPSGKPHLFGSYLDFDTN